VFGSDRRLRRRFYLHENEDEEKLADKIADLALKHKGSGRAVLVFALKVEDVEKILKKLAKDSTVQLTGTLRGLERDGLVKNPIFQRFLPESNRNKDVTPTPGTVYLVCTSAGDPVPLGSSGMRLSTEKNPWPGGRQNTNRHVIFCGRPFHGEKSVAQLKQDGAGE